MEDVLRVIAAAFSQGMNDRRDSSRYLWQMTEFLSIYLIEDSSVSCLTGESEGLRRLIYSSSVRASIVHGELYVCIVDNKIRGAAVWFAPGSDWKF